MVLQVHERDYQIKTQSNYTDSSHDQHPSSNALQIKFCLIVKSRVLELSLTPPLLHVGAGNNLDSI